MYINFVNRRKGETGETLSELGISFALATHGL